MGGENPDKLGSSFFQRLVEQSLAGAYLFGQHHFLYVNRAMAELFGYQPEEIVGKLGPLDLTHPEGQALVQEDVRRLLSAETEGALHQFRGLRKDGTSIWCEAFSRRIEYQGQSAVVGMLVDVTERKRAEEALWESEERFRQIAENALEWIWEVDANGLFTYASPIVEKILGYKPEEIVGEKHFYDLFHPEDREKMKNAAFEVFAKKLPFHELSNRNVHKTGKEVWLSTSGVPVLDKKGELLGYRGADTDITERKHMEEQLRESEERLRVMAYSAQDAVIMVDDEGKISFWNEAAEKIFGYTEKECTGKILHKFLAPERYRKAYLKGFEVFRVTGRGPAIGKILELTAVRKGGAEFPIELSLSAIKVRDKWNAVGIARDITKRRQMEEQLRSRGEELATLFELSTRLREAKSSDEILAIALREAGRQLKADAGWVELLSPDRTCFTITLADGFWQAHTGLTFPAVQGLCGLVLSTGEPYVSENYSVDPQALSVDAATETGPAVCALLRSEEELLGVLVLARRLQAEVCPFAPHQMRLLASIGEMVGTALRRQRLFESAQHRLRKIEALRTIDMAITGSLDLRVTFSVALDVITNQLGVDAAAILLLNTHTKTMEYAAWRGFITEGPRPTHLRLGEGYAGRAALERETVHIPNLSEIEPDPVQSPLLEEEGFATYYALPLIAKGRIQGVLEIFHRSSLESDGEWTAFLETLAGQTAIAIENVALFDSLERANIELIQAYDATIEGWGRALDLRDEETEGHSQRVTEMTVQLARAMGMSEEEIVHVRRGALLHDVGKIGIPDSILLKPGKLTDEEQKVIERHPRLAYEMLSPIAYLRPAIDIPYCHHEKWDGTGYPRGLKAEEIPLAACIFAVVDVFDALTSDRPYRKSWSKEKALRYIREQSGKHFNPRVVEAFLKMIVEGDTT